MKSFVQNSDRNKATIGIVAVTVLAASLMSSMPINKVEAAKGNGAKAPAPRAAALTTQEQISRTGDVRPVERPQDMSLDRKCKGPHRPRSCFPHQH